MKNWKNIHKYNGYMVSDCGLVKSLPSRYNGYKEILLKPDIGDKGYSRVNLSGKRFLVHRLVAMAFIPTISGKSFINHIDNNPRNNDVTNLEWCTHSENMIHSFNQNRSPQATRNLLDSAIKKRGDSIRLYKSKLGDRFIDMYSVECKNGTRGKVRCKCYCGSKIDTRTDSTIAKRGFTCSICNKKKSKDNK